MAASSFSAPQEQASDPVPVVKEPHHHLKLENEYMQALRVSIPAGESTLVHQHDVSYVYVSIGPADIINTPVGKPEIHAKLADGQLGFSKPIVHAATAVGIPFNNVTVELLQPQGEARNLCEKIVAGDAGPCDLSRADSKLPIRSTPLMETDTVRVYSVDVQPGTSLDSLRKDPSLVISVRGTPIVSTVPGKAQTTLQPGEFVWLPAQTMAKYTVAAGAECRLVLISFKAKPQ